MPLFLKEDFTANLIPALKAGELDVIVIALPFSEPGLVAQPVYDEPFRVVVPASHPGRCVARSMATNSTARTCCCSARAIASAIRCSNPARASMPRMRWSTRWKAVRWNHPLHGGQWRRAWRSCRVRRPIR